MGNAVRGAIRTAEAALSAKLTLEAARPNQTLLPQPTSGPLPQMHLLSFLSLSLIFVTQKENLLTRHSLRSLRGREGSSLSSHSPANRLTQPGASLINTPQPLSDGNPERRQQKAEAWAVTGRLNRDTASIFYCASI